MLIAAGVTITGSDHRARLAEKLKRICFNVEYQEKEMFDLPTRLIANLSHRAGVVEVSWK